MIDPEHFIWRRERHEHHSGATRTYAKSHAEKEPFPRGPGRSPINCHVCPRPNNTSGLVTKILNCLKYKIESVE